MEHHHLTHQGLVRNSNQDAVGVRTLPDGSLLLAVSDGMGGEKGGEVASGMLLEAVMAWDPPEGEATPEPLAALLEETDARIKAEAALLFGPEARMGATATLAWVRPGEALWVHAGDSRLSLLRQGELTRITEDQNVPGILLKEGRLRESELFGHPMSNQLINFLGAERFEADAGRLPLRPGDLLLLTSDGLTGLVPGARITRILMEPDPLAERLQRLCQAALDAGGFDNITIAATVV